MEIEGNGSKDECSEGMTPVDTSHGTQTMDSFGREDGTGSGGCVRGVFDNPDSEDSSDSSSNFSSESTSEMGTVAAVRFCSKCGMRIEEGASFCGSCGGRIEHDAVNASEAFSGNKGPKLKLLAALSAFAVVVVVVVVAFVIPALTVTYDELIEEGKYEEAYEKASNEEKLEVLKKLIELGEFQTAYDVASDEEKQNVLLANLTAYTLKYWVVNLRDQDSFRLRSLNFNENDHEFVVYEGSKDTYGIMLYSWDYYTFDEDDQEYQLLVYFGDLEDEVIDGGSDASLEETKKKMIRNIARGRMRTMLESEETKVPDAYVEALNALYETKGFGGVELIPSVELIYPLDEVA